MKYSLLILGLIFFTMCSDNRNGETEGVDTVENIQNQKDINKIESIKKDEVIKEEDVQITNIYSNSPEIKFLDSIYVNNLTHLKKAFFRKWYNKSKKLDVKNTKVNDSLTEAIQLFFKDLFLPDIDTTIRHTYASGYYDPFKEEYIKRIQSTGCFIKSEYFILRPTVTCYIFEDSTFQVISKPVPNLYEDECKYKIEAVCYYPDIQFKDKKKLYLTDEYKTILDSFIQSPFDREDRTSKFIINERRKFLGPEIELSKQHSWYFYHYVTFPEIRTIFFNEDFNQANVQLRTSWDKGGYAIYRKVMNTWRCEEYKRFTWNQ